jgi:hypothetical protein
MLPSRLYGSGFPFPLPEFIGWKVYCIKQRVESKRMQSARTTNVPSTMLDNNRRRNICIIKRNSKSHKTNQYSSMKDYNIPS